MFLIDVYATWSIRHPAKLIFAIGDSQRDARNGVTRVWRVPRRRWARAGRLHTFHEVHRCARGSLDLAVYRDTYSVCNSRRKRERERERNEDEGSQREAERRDTTERAREPMPLTGALLPQSVVANLYDKQPELGVHTHVQPCIYVLSELLFVEWSAKKKKTWITDSTIRVRLTFYSFTYGV